ncbi:armadillo-type protein, partial [Mycena alexandri]
MHIIDSKPKVHIIENIPPSACRDRTYFRDAPFPQHTPRPPGQARGGVPITPGSRATTGHVNGVLAPLPGAVPIPWAGACKLVSNGTPPVPAHRFPKNRCVSSSNPPLLALAPAPHGPTPVPRPTEWNFGVKGDGGRLHRGDRASSNHARSISYQYTLGSQAARALHHLLDAGHYASWTTQSISEEHRNHSSPWSSTTTSAKRVQEAGCSAFATLEEDAGIGLTPYLEPVLQNLVIMFDKYQHKNMLILYDAVGTLADAVGWALQNPRYVEILMPPLTNRWARLKDDDEDLIPLLECLASVTIAIGVAFLPYAGPVFEHCNNVIHTALLKYQAFQKNPELEEPDKSILVVALDLLSGLTQGLGMELQPLIAASNPNLLSLLTVCLKHPQAPSVGEVVLRYGPNNPEFKQWVDPLIARLIPILLHPKVPRSLHENAAV